MTRGASVPGALEPEVPADVQRVVSITVVADMLGFDERRVRGWVERGKVDYGQLDKGLQRFIPVTEVVRIAKRYGVEVNWDPARP